MSWVVVFLCFTEISAEGFKTKKPKRPPDTLNPPKKQKNPSENQNHAVDESGFLKGSVTLVVSIQYVNKYFARHCFFTELYYSRSSRIVGRSQENNLKLNFISLS